MIDVRHGAAAPRLAEAVLFPFDDHAIPFSAGLRLHLVPGKGPGVGTPIVLGKGPEGAPDAKAVRFYGSVIPTGDELRMYYLGSGPGRGDGRLRPLWYEVWGLGDVRLATWPRDRLGYFQKYDYPRRPAWLPVGETHVDVAPHVITCPLRANGVTRVFINADGLGEHSALKVEVLDEQFRSLPSYSGDACLPLNENGLRTPVRWRDRETIAAIDGSFRLQLTFTGVHPEVAKLFAVYVTTADG